MTKLNKFIQIYNDILCKDELNYFIGNFDENYIDIQNLNNNEIYLSFEKKIKT
jgi:hypothetical protein